ncbi:hypothetical protein F5Y18DRAFT_414571 [Xylariaceae sp. FL1019]|nr:hypothetical protein F5Y18DRAFT_414571 [Xylariaceae sp. FL1019]
MEDSGSAPDGDSTSEASSLPEVVIIAEHGNVILDATFENSKETIRAARREAKPKFSSQRDPPPQLPSPKTRVRIAFRAELDVLKKQSKYFDKLLGDKHFKEANDITDAFAALDLKNLKPIDAAIEELPWIRIHDDDQATSYAYREHVFADLLRILHGQDAKTSQPQLTMSFVTALAVMADRFDCAAAVSRYVSTGLKFKWPVASRPKPVKDDGNGNGNGGMSRASENTLRQRILVSWLLNMPVRFQTATKELIMNGSCQWSSFAADENEAFSATWWYLQDGLEQELQYRRNCVLNTIASVQRHFISLYTSRSARQCKLGYDSSVACDSYQLGEIFKFLMNKGLLFLVDFSPGSFDSIADTSLLPVDNVIATLRQCPSYQIDKHHTNCGLRTRILPILDFIQGLLSANSVPITRASWTNNRQTHAWMTAESLEPNGKLDERVFRFTRNLAGDQRLRFENAMGADKFARDVFTASSWDWSADLQPQDHISTTPRWSFK